MRYRYRRYSPLGSHYIKAQVLLGHCSPVRRSQQKKHLLLYRSKLKMVQCAMLTAPALLVLLPLALASCPCPPAPAPASSKVCGSNFVTYDSQCHLDCASLPGVSALHRGPCSPIESALGVMGPLRNVSLPAGAPSGAPNNVRLGSARADADTVNQCVLNNGCSVKTCSECSSYGAGCPGKCIIDCACDCYGISGSSMDNIVQIAECLDDNNCVGKRTSCESSCRTQSCLDSCYIDSMKCICECNDAISMRPALGLGVALLALWVFQAAAGK